MPGPLLWQLICSSDVVEMSNALLKSDSFPILATREKYTLPPCHWKDHENNSGQKAVDRSVIGNFWTTASYLIERFSSTPLHPARVIREAFHSVESLSGLSLHEDNMQQRLHSYIPILKWTCGQSQNQTLLWLVSFNPLILGELFVTAV